MHIHTSVAAVGQIEELDWSSDLRVPGSLPDPALNMSKCVFEKDTELQIAPDAAQLVCEWLTPLIHRWHPAR